MDVPNGGVDDMTKLAYLHEPGVLDNLRSRYDLDEIYTYTGSILIAVNPFAKLPHLYDVPMMEQYKGVRLGELSPHVFAIAESAYSRFGKFVEIQFDKSGRISGAAVRTYLLERSRVVQVSDPERNYHCFYQLCAGANAEEAQRLKLGPAQSFHYLNQSSCYELTGKDSNATEFARTKHAMDVVGVSPDEQDGGLLPGASAKLVLEEVQQVQLSNAVFRVLAAILHLGNVNFAPGSDADSSVVADEKSRLHLEAAAELFQCGADRLEESLCTRTLVTVGESIKKALTPTAAVASRDTLAKTVYSRLFDWLVEKINKSIGQDPDSTNLIGVLDIYGFESFKCNSMFPKSTHETFATKLFQTLGKHSRLSKPKFSQTNFTVDHYAGQVTYDTELFLDKNKDYVIAEHQTLLGNSGCSFVAALFPQLQAADSKTKFSSLGSRFKQQLAALMETLNTTEPHYIRCVKPNGANVAGRFENANVLQQLRCGGVLEAVRISCAGYPTRRTFDDFLDRFGMLSPDLLDGRYDEKVAVQKLLEVLKLNNFQIGKTMVFLRAGQMAELDSMRAEKLSRAARVIQRCMRTFLLRKQFLRLRRAAIKAQTLYRGPALMLVVRWQAQAKFLKAKKAAIVLQAGARGMAARKLYQHARKTRAAIKMQRTWRGAMARASYKKSVRRIVRLQSTWRARIARFELRKLKMEARQTGALQAAKTKLEKQCEELTWRLQLEKRMREVAKLQAALEAVRAELVETRAQLSKEVADRKLAQVHPLPSTPSPQAQAQPQSPAPTAAPPAALGVQLLREKDGSAPPSPPVRSEVNREVALKAEKLSLENERLKALLEESDSRAADAERQLTEAAERARRLDDAETAVRKMQEALSRYGAGLRLEQENQVLRQQALTMTPPKSMGRQLSLSGSFLSRTSYENGVGGASPGNADHRLLDSPSDSEQEALLQAIGLDLGFSIDRPVAACVVYKCLLQWRSFEAERTNVFDRIIQTIGGAIESQDSNNVLGYWLANTSVLLFLLQRTLKASGSLGGSQQRRRPGSATLFGRMTQGFRGSPTNGMAPGGGAAALSVDQVRQVDAKYPALLFKQQLTAYVEKIYGMIRDNLKKDISPMLGSCIQAPRASRSGMSRASQNRSPQQSHQQQALSSHWGAIIAALSGLLNTVRANNVPAYLVRKLFTQIFSFINVQLFNSLLLRRECCSFSNGEYVKAGLAELEHWIFEAGADYAGSSWDELKYIRQAVGFLVIHQKPKKSLDEITHDLCPVLSIQQLYRISTMYWDDKYGTHSVSPDVISSMRVLMTEDSNTAVSNSFLLDDDSRHALALARSSPLPPSSPPVSSSVPPCPPSASPLRPSLVPFIIPFSVDDISKSITEVDLSDIEPPQLLRENGSFSFLLTLHE
eukprot:jgi/Mesen1/4754/ME000242S03925